MWTAGASSFCSKNLCTRQAEPRGLISVLGLWYFVLFLGRSRPVFVVCFYLKLDHSLSHCPYFHQVLNQENILSLWSSADVFTLLQQLLPSATCPFCPHSHLCGVCVVVCVHVGLCTMVFVWRSEVYLSELVLSSTIWDL